MQADYQRCYVLAIVFDLVPKDIKAKLVKHLVEKIHENNDLLDTGFLATPYLLDVLTDNGQTKLAQKLFLRDECPSWLYEVKSGAATVWESWAWTSLMEQWEDFLSIIMLWDVFWTGL